MKLIELNMSAQTDASEPQEDKRAMNTEQMRLLLDREISWIRFNERVLELAADQSIPVLERLRFLGIFTSNLDEFYMKRVGGLKRQVMAGVTETNSVGHSPQQQITNLRAELKPGLKQQSRLFRKVVLPELQSNSIELVLCDALSGKERKFAENYFSTQVFPLLTPLAVDAGHPFPMISNLSTSIGVAVALPGHEEPNFARIKISHIYPQWIQLPGSRGGNFRFLSLQSLIVTHLDQLFPDVDIISHMPFRVTRNADLEVDAGEDADDLLELIEEELRQRRFARVIRLEHGTRPDPWILSFLMHEMDLKKKDVYEVNGPLDFTFFKPLLDLPLADLKYPVQRPIVRPLLQEDPSLFNILKQHNEVLLHHPYESFSASVERFIREAAEDPDVMTIKMTLYRIGDSSPFIPLLIKAAEWGKTVVCLIELQARFDEERNVQWANTLEEAGVHVVYGIPGLKTHAKTALVIRKEQAGLKTYAHVGTGNYHPETAKQYTDFGIFVTSEKITGELLHFFNYLTGRSLKEDYKHLLVAPNKMEPAFLELIQNEAENASKNIPSGIIAVMNGLEDRHIISALYDASMAGVSIKLVVRGVCSLLPGVKGLSENIEVVSILGRFLEHTRVFYFANGSHDEANGAFFIGSGDWRERNMHRRVELAIPVSHPDNKRRLYSLLQIMTNSAATAWRMDQSGNYENNSKHNSATNSDKLYDVQQAVYDFTVDLLQNQIDQ